MSNGEYPLVCPGCLCVAPSPENWCDAVARVVLPQQVANVARFIPRWPQAGTRGLADNVSDFMRQWLQTGVLRYIADPKGCDLWGQPLATFMRRGGDCDDLAALGVSLLLYLGVDTDMMVGFACKGGKCDGHAWVEGHDERGWFLLEATSGALYRGERPAMYRAQYQLRPGRCLDVREEATRRAAAVAIASRG
jgi:hypothetical protein